MMRPLTLKEFAQQLRAEGNEFADEILDLLDVEEEVAEPYGELCSDLEHYAPEHRGNPNKALEWLGDRSNLLKEIEDQLKDDGRDGDADDVIKEMLGTLAEAEEILEATGWPADGDFIDGIQALAERPAPMEYDL